MTASQFIEQTENDRKKFIDIQYLKPDTILLTLPIIEEAITHLSSDSTKLVGKVHSLETFFKLKCFNASTFWSNKSN